MDLLISLVVLIVMLVFVWAVVWAVNTYIVGRAPFIAEEFKQIITWIVMVVAVVVSIILIWNWIGGIGFSSGSILRR